MEEMNYDALFVACFKVTLTFVDVTPKVIGSLALTLECQTCLQNVMTLGVT